MVKRLKTLTKTRFKRTDLNSFFFFLFFAVVIWFFVQFSKQYNELIDIPIKYVNIPPDKFITGQNPRSLQLLMNENGFKIAWFSLFPPTLQVDVSKTLQQEGSLVYVFDDHRNEIISQLDIDLEDTRFMKDRITINYQQKKEKKLPVISRIGLDFAPGYSQIEPLYLEPDSVMVSGPDAMLDTLTQLVTEELKLQKIKENVSGIVPIDTTGLEDITLYTPKVKYGVEVEKFTEGTVELAVELINVPEDLNVVIFPKTVVLFFQVALKDYNKVNASDFRVIADFSKLTEGQDFLIPQVVKKPGLTSNIRLNENKIQFIIKK